MQQRQEGTMKSLLPHDSEVSARESLWVFGRLLPMLHYSDDQLVISRGFDSTWSQ
jgi:hypothetical protein